MSNGILSTSGQNWVLQTIADGINTLGGIYVGLMTNNVPPERSLQTPSGIIELSSSTCGGYSRIKCSGFVKVSTGANPYIIGSGVTFTVASGSWPNVYGYFVAKDTNDTILWSEVLPFDKCGLMASGNPIIVTPIYYQY